MTDEWDVHSVYIVLNLLEDTSTVSLASSIKVKAAVGLHAYWWADEPALQNWIIGSVLISTWQQLELNIPHHLWKYVFHLPCQLIMIIVFLLLWR